MPIATTKGMRRIAELALIATSFAVAHAAVNPPQNEHPYRTDWKRATFGKAALAGTAAKAGVGQLTGHPQNYGGGAAGFGKRVGAGFAAHAVETSVEHLVAAPLHEELQYHPSGKTGFGPRLWYALKSTVVTRNTKTGKNVPAVGRLSGNAAAGVVSQVALHAGSGAATAGFGLGFHAGTNVAREFWPRKKPKGA
jgi:hypothetical protein